MEVEQRYGDQVTFVGVPGLADANAMEEFITETGVEGFVHIPDTEGVVWDKFGITEQRTYVYINDDGTWQTSGYGSLGDDVADLIAR